MNRRDLISDAYLAEQKALHAAPRGYGGKGYKWADMVMEIVRYAGCTDSVLDYGAGQGTLAAELRLLGVTVRNYDPAIEKWSALPEPATLVVSTDVLEHVEAEKLPAVLDHLASLGTYVLAVIGLAETDKRLSDGRQAHISLHPADWWIEQFRSRSIHLRVIQNTEKHLALVARIR